ncbi:MAG: DNA alkylation repair protein [Firmicutes bacterium]|nr:DNA alkylation repair protein [Bacillota bacterium]
MTNNEIRQELFKMQDTGYRDFQLKLIPNVDPDTVIGTRTPQLRAFAKEIQKQGSEQEFLEELPHQYFDENQLHAFVLSEVKNFERCIREVDRFLPYIDNWATCDQLSPKVFRKNREQLLSHIRRWIASDKVYTVRFAIGMLMQHFLDEAFDSEYPEMVAGVKSDEYYINMMIAWYFATALAKQYKAVLPYIEEQRLTDWTHNKAIQKAIESRRISDEQKQYLRSLKTTKR